MRFTAGTLPAPRSKTNPRPGEPACQGLIADPRCVASPSPHPAARFWLTPDLRPILPQALAPRPRSGSAAPRVIPSPPCPSGLPLCRYGSSSVRGALRSVGAGHRPGQALASLPPSVALRPARIRPSGSRSTKPPLSDPPQAAAGQVAQGGGSLSRRAPCSPSRAHHGDGLAEHPRQAKPVTAARIDSGRLKAAPPWQPAPRRACHGSRRQSAAEAGGPPGHPGRFFPVRSWGENRKKTSLFFAQRRSL